MPVPSEDKWKSIADEFYERWNFHNCIGAIDGKHVMIQCPFNSGSLFYNYKSYFSVVLLAVASADYRFVMVDVGAYGSSNDSGALNHTTFFKQLRKKNLDVPPRQLPIDTEETHVPYVLLGDEAFPLRFDLMRPFARHGLTNERHIFNYSLSRARRVVEMLLVYWPTNGRLYNHHIYLNPDNVTTVVKATVVLHNILTLPNDKVHTDVVDNRAEIHDDAFQDLARQGNWPAIAANDVRNYFTDYFNSDHGSVEWQNNCA